MNKYEVLYKCLDELRKEISLSATTDIQEDKKSIDIIKITAEKINSRKVNVFKNDDVNWEEVTMFDIDNIKRLLTLLNTSVIQDVCDSIVMAIDAKYNPDWPFYKPEVHSDYYNPSDAILCEENDWDYQGTINHYASSIIEQRKRAEEYEKKNNIQNTTQTSIKVDNNIQSDVIGNTQSASMVALSEKNKEIEELKKQERETSLFGKRLTTGQVIHLVHTAKLCNSSSNAQIWATVLHLLTGCSINRLRTKFNKDDNISDSAKAKVDKLYNDTLTKLKQSSKS